jgi:hypothetical protein
MQVPVEEPTYVYKQHLKQVVLMPTSQQSTRKKAFNATQTGSYYGGQNPYSSMSETLLLVIINIFDLILERECCPALDQRSTGRILGQC